MSVLCVRRSKYMIHYVMIKILLLLKTIKTSRERLKKKKKHNIDLVPALCKDEQRSTINKIEDDTSSTKVKEFAACKNLRLSMMS